MDDLAEVDAKFITMLNIVSHSTQECWEEMLEYKWLVTLSDQSEVALKKDGENSLVK